MSEPLLMRFTFESPSNVIGLTRPEAEELYKALRAVLDNAKPPTTGPTGHVRMVSSMSMTFVEHGYNASSYSLVTFNLPPVGGGSGK